MERKRFQIFISSTYEDLKEIRSRAIAEILKMGHIPIGMEMFNPDNQEQWVQIQRNINESDYYLIIVAKRYGSLTRKHISYTEKEYNYAVRIGIPIIRLIMSENARVESQKMEDDPEKLVKLKKFITKLKKKPVAFWNDEGDFASKLISSVNYYIREYPREGWTKANSFVDIETVEKYGLNDYVDRQFQIIRESLQKGLYYDYYRRRIELNINQLDMSLEVVVVNEVLIKNFKDVAHVYNPCPVFETEEQAMSYQHLQFRLNDIERKDIITKTIEKREGDVQLPYAVHNTFDYSGYSDVNDIHIYHKYSYKREDINFFMLYQLRNPCRELSISIHLNNDVNNQYRILAFVFAHLEDQRNRFTKKEFYSEEHSCNITFNDWIAPGCGFNIIVTRTS